MGRTGITDAVVQRPGYSASKLQLLGHHIRRTLQIGGHDEMLNVADGELRLIQCRPDSLGHDLRITFVADPPFFPAIVALGVRRPEMIDENFGERR